jgi:phytoene dehydrogenase-like protein
MTTEQPVVIIGAGPVGLTAALTLLQEGQKVVIYDALARGRNGSRAAVIHAHTLEVRFILSWSVCPQYCPLSNSIPWVTPRNSSRKASKAKAS